MGNNTPPQIGVLDVLFSTGVGVAAMDWVTAGSVGLDWTVEVGSLDVPRVGAGNGLVEGMIW